MNHSIRLAALGLCLLGGISLHASRTFRDGGSPEMLKRAEEKAGPAGRKILAGARVMTVEKKEILPGALHDLRPEERLSGLPGQGLNP